MEVRQDRGVEYNSVVSDKEIEGSCSYEEKRLIFKGKVSFELMKNSWKFGKQIQVVLFGKDLKFETRSPNANYNRIEIAIPFEIGKKLLEEFGEVLKNEL